MLLLSKIFRQTIISSIQNLEELSFICSSISFLMAGFERQMGQLFTGPGAPAKVPSRRARSPQLPK